MVYRPSLEVQFGDGKFFVYHHVNPECLLSGGCTLYSRKEDFGWAVQPLPKRARETPESRERAIQAARDDAVAAAVAAAC